MGEVVKSPKYTVEEVERALLDLALCGGNSCMASRRLAAAGLEVSDRLLRMWRSDRYPARYSEISQEQAPKVEEVIVQQARETAVYAAEVERLALQETEAQLRAHQVRDAAGAARNIATTKAINVDKLLTMTGRPEKVTEVRKPEETLRWLKEMGVLRVIDGDSSESSNGARAALPAAPPASDEEQER